MINEVPLADVPKNLAETLRDDDSWKESQMHSGLSGGQGTFSSVTHGSEVDVKENIKRYFRRIDKGLHELLKDEREHLNISLKGDTCSLVDGL